MQNQAAHDEIGESTIHKALVGGYCHIALVEDNVPFGRNSREIRLVGGSGLYTQRNSKDELADSGRETGKESVKGLD